MRVLNRAGSVCFRNWLRYGERGCKTVTPEHLFETPYHSPQPPRWTWGEDRC